MPTIARRPAAQQERQRLQARRLRAAELFATGVRQVEVARQLGVSRQSVHLWYQRWQADGADGLRSRGRRCSDNPSPFPPLASRAEANVEPASVVNFRRWLWLAIS
jgi:hypothetical protein